MEKVSILLPTRGRFESFCKSVDSLLSTCHNVNNVEIMVALDNDDLDTAAEIMKFVVDKSDIKIHMYERHRYKGLHHYYNDLAKRSSGTSLMLWNDDALMLSFDWDISILEAHRTYFGVLRTEVDNMPGWSSCFPAIPKQWVNVTGDMSGSPSVDSWLDLVGKGINRIQELPSVRLFHDRFDLTGNHIDATHHDTREDVARGFPANPEMLNEHTHKLLEYINTHQK